MIEKWKLNIKQKCKSDYGDYELTNEVMLTHNQFSRICDVVTFINDNFPEELKFKIESVSEEEEADDVDE